MRSCGYRSGHSSCQAAYRNQSRRKLDLTKSRRQRRPVWTRRATVRIKWQISGPHLMSSGSGRQQLILHRAKSQLGGLSAGTGRLVGPEPVAGRMMQMQVDQRPLHRVLLVFLAAMAPDQLRQIQIVAGDLDDDMGRGQSPLQGVVEPQHDHIGLRLPAGPGR